MSHSLSVDAALLTNLGAIAREAGYAIMNYRAGGFTHEKKQDKSPVTEADVAADKVITASLIKLNSAIPVVSEEGGNLPDVATLPERFWLVDPLDGTKGFIRGEPFFTVNIALIMRDKTSAYPVCGVIYAPALEELYAGGEKLGAYRETGAGKESICTRVAPIAGLKVLVSNRHGRAEDFATQSSHKVAGIEKLSSSIKFCRLAEGLADLYPRFGPTMEWDTAAGQAILEAAGGAVVSLPHKERFHYGKPNYNNYGFLAAGKQDFI